MALVKGAKAYDQTGDGGQGHRLQGRRWPADPHQSLDYLHHTLAVAAASHMAAATILHRLPGCSPTLAGDAIHLILR